MVFYGTCKNLLGNMEDCDCNCCCTNYLWRSPKRYGKPDSVTKPFSTIFDSSAKKGLHAFFRIAIVDWKAWDQVDSDKYPRSQQCHHYQCLSPVHLDIYHDSPELRRHLYLLNFLFLPHPQSPGLV